MLLLALPLHAATLEVGSTKAYKTITAAISAAATGDTVKVDPGTYAENIAPGAKALILQSTSGAARTTIVSTAALSLTTGTLDGFTIESSATIAVYVPSGAPNLREIMVNAPAKTGVVASGGTPTITEVLVNDAGLHGFQMTGGSPTLKRCISRDAANTNFLVATAGTYSNLLSLGGSTGLRSDAASTWDHAVSLGAVKLSASVSASATFKNGVYDDTPLTVQCFGGAVATFTNGIAHNLHNYKDCAATVLNNTVDVDPEFTSWTSASPTYAIDLHPVVGSPMINVGNDTDADGSKGDFGIFGGANGVWSDRDADGVEVLFDCDDHDKNTYFGARERADGFDNDCDGSVDEDVAPDTGGIDDTGDTGDTDDTGDTGTADLDGDGYPASVDCSEHNVATHPGAVERTDGADNDCDGAIDEATAAGDDDADGFSELDGDCDDTDAARYPGAPEPNARDGIDQDCDGADDHAGGQDADGDGINDTDDCDDTDAAVHAGVADPVDGVDNDCDGVTDEDGLDDDRDGDGYTTITGDCDDNDAGVYEGAVDIPDDFIDQDCTGEDNYDLDRDGNPAPVSGGTDCDDARDNVAPGKPELCDGLDNDCNDAIDDACTGGNDGEVIEPAECGCAAGGGALGAWTAALALTTFSRRRRNDSATNSNKRS